MQKQTITEPSATHATCKSRKVMSGITSTKTMKLMCSARYVALNLHTIEIPVKCLKHVLKAQGENSRKTKPSVSCHIITLLAHVVVTTRAEEVSLQIIKMVARDMLASTFVEGESFRALMVLVEPEYKPHRAR